LHGIVTNSLLALRLLASRGETVLVSILLGHLLNHHTGRQSRTLLKGTFSLKHGAVVARKELLGESETTTILVANPTVYGRVSARSAVVGGLVTMECGTAVRLWGLLLEKLVDSLHLCAPVSFSAGKLSR
jgi:hypothetical protein